MAAWSIWRVPRRPDHISGACVWPPTILRHAYLLPIVCCLLFGLTGLPLILLNPLGVQTIAAQGTTFYVATNGSNTTGNGSGATPWATIGHALNEVPDGSTILVRPGTYTGLVRLDASFALGVVVRSEQPYQARLRNDEAVVISYYGQGITLEGFDIAHSGPGSGALVIQIQNLREQGFTSRITLRNNVLHDSYNNDILKINNGARLITVTGNIFFNQSGSDEHIDVNSVTGVMVEDNIFFNDFAGSGRTNGNDTSAFVVIKDSNGDSDNQLGSTNITVRRNVFLNYEGSTGHGFLQIGEDGTANYEADNVLVENNLLLGNARNRMRAPFAVMGSRNVTIRNNTVSGDLPALAFGMRLYTFGANQPNADIRFYNNIWSDPGATMGAFSDTPPEQTDAFTLDHNLYWNGGQPIPSDANDLVNSDDDANGVLGNPLLGAQAGLILPRWNQGTGLFGDGSTTIRQAFTRLVNSYGTPAAGSAALDQALPAQTPADDILGSPRPLAAADLGARELFRASPLPLPSKPQAYLPLLRAP